jgi:hypothetical protein
MCALNDPPHLYTKELSVLPDNLFRQFGDIWGFGAVLFSRAIALFSGGHAADGRFWDVREKLIVYGLRKIRESCLSCPSVYPP